MKHESHDLHGAGFERLGNLLPNPAEFSPPDAIYREGRGRGGRESLPLPEENAFYITTQEAFREEKVRLGDARGKGRKRRDPSQSKPVDIRNRALVLARQLDDERSIAFYRLVVRKVPEHLVRDALIRALDLPKRDARRSRAALFTSIVREHLGKRASARHRND